MAVSMLRCEEDTVRRDLRQEKNNPLSLSLSLFGQEPDLTSKSSQDVNQHWRSRSDKVEGRGTCTMFQIYLNSGTRRYHICVQLFPGESNGCKSSYGSIRPRKIAVTIVMASIGSCLVMGHSSCQIKRCLTYCPCHSFIHRTWIQWKMSLVRLNH